MSSKRAITYLVLCILCFLGVLAMAVIYGAWRTWELKVVGTGVFVTGCIFLALAQLAFQTSERDRQ